MDIFNDTTPQERVVFREALTHYVERVKDQRNSITVSSAASHELYSLYDARYQTAKELINKLYGNNSQ